MAVDKFEVGKWYLYVGPKNKLVSELKHIADSKPRQCLKAQGERGAIFSDMKNERPLNGGLWKFNRNDFAEVEPPSHPKTKNKYRSFTKDDIGKTFTVRQWDDMANEFEIDSSGSIMFEGHKIRFVESMRKFCGKSIGLNDVYSDGTAYIFGHEYIIWLPQMFEECIIKEPKAGYNYKVTIKNNGIHSNIPINENMTASDIKESIEKDIASIGPENHGNIMGKDGGITHGFISTSRFCADNLIDRLYNQPLPSTVKGFSGLIEEMNNSRDELDAKNYHANSPSLGPEWGRPFIEQYMWLNKQDKTKFNTDLIKTEKLNFRMDR